jgi:hypothetical protein
MDIKALRAIEFCSIKIDIVCAVIKFYSQNKQHLIGLVKFKYLGFAVLLTNTELYYSYIGFY